MVRVMMESLNDGFKFPIYFDGEKIEEQIAEASDKLGCKEIGRQESDQFQMLCEQVTKLTSGDSSSRKS